MRKRKILEHTVRENGEEFIKISTGTALYSTFSKGFRRFETHVCLYVGGPKQYLLHIKRPQRLARWKEDEKTNSSL